MNWLRRLRCLMGRHTWLYVAPTAEESAEHLKRFYPWDVYNPDYRNAGPDRRDRICRICGFADLRLQNALGRGEEQDSARALIESRRRAALVERGDVIEMRGRR